MFEVHAHIDINLPREQCWEKLKDLSLAANYIPDVTRIAFITDQKQGVGTQRTALSSKWPTWSHETVISWVDGYSFSLRLHRGKKRTFFWFDELQFHYLLEDIESATRFKPIISYIPRFKQTTDISTKMLTQKLWVICHAMKKYYETNVPVSPKNMMLLNEEIAAQNFQRREH